MFSASKLSGEQKAALAEWAAGGDSIADLQRRLKEEYDLTITYMDARFLVLDLGIEIIPPQSEEPAAPAQEIPAGEEGIAQTPAEETPAPSAGPCSVSMDEIARPGAVVSGKVTFSDGESAVWMIDQYGRPSLDPDTEGYRPSREDIESFQKELSELMRKQGY